MSGPGHPYGQAAPPYVQPGYQGDIPMTSPYPNAPYPSAPYPPNPYQSGPNYPPAAPSEPPSYPGYGAGYPYESKPYPGDPMNQSGGQPYPPSGPAYSQSGPGYFPGGGIMMPPRPMSPPSNIHVYQPNSEDHEQIIARTDGQDGWAGSSFNDKRIRHMFIRKVYLILMAQLLVTVAFVAVFLFSPSVRRWVHQNAWFYYCSYAVFLVTYIILVCCDSIRRRWPANILCLTLFTLAMSYMTGTISSMYNTDIVFIAVAITAAVCLAVSIFAIQTRIDFTLCSGLIFVLAMVLFFFGIAVMITFAVSGPNYILSCVYGAVAALIFAVFLIFDTQMVVGGKHRRYQLSPEEYIYGALQLYVDIVNLFILLLGLIGKRN